MYLVPNTILNHYLALQAYLVAQSVKSLPAVRESQV